MILLVLSRLGTQNVGLHNTLLKLLGFVKTLRQDMGVIPFNIHCTRDDRFVTKLMNTHRLINEVPDHSTYRQI